jgi:hypothetical protein
MEIFPYTGKFSHIFMVNFPKISYFHGKFSKSGSFSW